ncbi:MAG: hypothetical protein JF614_11235 [Acidobacteria bacterium]|nr:hypothetical protein [Acidobacteriota bacterium]
MKNHRILVLAVVLLAIPALASAATPIPQEPAAGVTPVVAQAAVPSLDAFLSALNNPAGAPVNKAANSCGPNFCTQAQRTACAQQCAGHHGGGSVGLQCCSDCTTLCICGSVPVGC